MNKKFAEIKIFGKIIEIGKITTTDNGKRVLSVKIPDNMYINKKLQKVPFEVSFWDDAAEQVAELPLGTPIVVEGALNVSFFNKDKTNGNPSASFTVSAWSYRLLETKNATPTTKTEQNSTQNVEQPSTPLPAELQEVMKKGKHAGKTLWEIFLLDRDYINDLVTNDRTPEDWKQKLVKASNAFDNYMRSHAG